MLKKFTVVLKNEVQETHWANSLTHLELDLLDRVKEIEAITETPRQSIADLPEDFTERFARKFVIDHLKWEGSYRDLLTIDDWANAYLMCDGFGQVDRKWATEQCWDWSHVRDSSTETFIKVANHIWQTVWNHNDSTTHDHCANMVGQAVLGGLDPLLLLE